MTNSPATAKPSLLIDRLADGTTVLQIETALAEARISLFGGQVLSWKPVRIGQPVLWFSPLASLDGTRAIRGGVPICWPWFGAHPASTSLPAHGLARLNRWRVERVQLAEDGVVEFVMTLPPVAVPPGATAEESGSALRLSQTIRIGDSLSISLTTRNEGRSDQRYSEGLHTYFEVGDIADVSVEGLGGCRYADLAAGNVRRTQEGAIAFDGETARLFVGTEDACTIVDRVLGRRIRVEKSGSRSTAVWNPGPEVASRMSDLGATGWRAMVCVETANALDDAIVLAPGEHHRMTAHYSVEPLT